MRATSDRVAFACVALEHYLGGIKLRTPEDGSPAFRDLVGAGLCPDGSYNVSAVGSTIARIQRESRKLRGEYLSDRGLVMDWCRQHGLVKA